MRKSTNLPYIEHRINETDVGLGGHVMRMSAAAALKLGDVVYISGTRAVNKSTTLANHSLICGVVVGGTNTDYGIVTDPASYNVITAADINETVLVQFNGIVYVIVDNAIAVGSTVIPDTVTAGRVKIAVAALTITAGATPVTSTAANGAIISGDGTYRAVGKLLQASSGANQIRPILLTLGA